MSNNDWQQPNQTPGQPGQPPQQPGADQSPVRTYPSGPPPASDSPADMLTEGWGVGKPLGFEEISARFKLALKRSTGSILKTWLLISLVGLAVNLIGAVAFIGAYYAGGGAIASLFEIFVAIFGFLAYPVIWFLGVLQWALFKPMHRLIFEDSSDTLGIMGTLKSAGSVYLFTLLAVLVVSIGFGIGSVFCIIPGLFLAFVLCQTPYLAAARELPFGEALKSSLSLNKAYWPGVLGALGAVVVAVVFLFGLSLAFGFVARFMYPFHALIGSVISWAFTQAFTFAVFLIQVAVFSSIETKETGKVPVP